MLNDQIILEELSNDAVSHCIVFVLFLALVSKNSVNILEQMFYQCSHTAVGQTVSLLPRCCLAALFLTLIHTTCSSCLWEDGNSPCFLFICVPD